jgi:ATP adenylyltransferase
MVRGWAAEERVNPDWYRPGGIRDQVLYRDEYTCQIRGPRCRLVATTVDHIIPKAEGGSDDLRNLRAACSTCNSGRRPTTLTQPKSVTRW